MDGLTDAEHAERRRRLLFDPDGAGDCEPQAVDWLSEFEAERRACAEQREATPW